MSTDPQKRTRLVNALSVDVEDYYQVQALENAYERDDWDNLESRVERNVDRLLAVCSEAGASGTFFSLGWIAQRHKAMMRRIVDAGHEVASHGYAHYRVDGQTPDAFRGDIRKSKKILEDCTGTPVRGYRAATFSVSSETPWAFRILEEEGYSYGSSIYPIKSDNYSFEGAPRFAHHPAGTKAFIEIPITTIRLGKWNLPCGGGGYFRFFPYAVSKAAISHINTAEKQPAVFYLHPWEIDPEQPRPSGLSFKSRFRHYLNLEKTEARLKRLLHDFAWDRMDRVFGKTAS